MATADSALVCWHAERAGVDVLRRALVALRNRRVHLDEVLYLVQEGRNSRPLPGSVEGVRVEVLLLPVADPTHHRPIYELVRDVVVPRLQRYRDVHVNVSPGTPAMHAVWIVLHAGGVLPDGARLWSSQFNPDTKRTRIDTVEFPITTYLSEVRRVVAEIPALAAYAPEARSAARRGAFERLARYASIPDAPLLVLGERGTGKTRLVETYVAALKQRPNVVTVPCGGLDSTLADSVLFGHTKGAFTGAAEDRAGVLAEAAGGVLFLDEVQDLPQGAQRKLVRVFQDRRHRFRPVGSDHEVSTDAELVCASNLSLAGLRERLDADLFDRLSLMSVTIPPLRECREDLRDDWQGVWHELRRTESLPTSAPWNEALADALSRSPLPGNLRDLQRLALLVVAWWSSAEPNGAIARAVAEWSQVPSPAPSEGPFGSGSRRERMLWFRRELAGWAKERFGSWAAAATALGCDEKTLRQDSKSAQPEPDSAE